METKKETNPEKAVKKPKNKLLTLIVKAQELYPLPPNEPNVDANTSLSNDDGFGSGFGTTKKNFETHVFKNFKITWDIEVENKTEKDKEYKVELVSINHNPKPSTNPNLFDHNPLTPKPKSNNKSIQGTIVNAPSSPENYTINFQILKNDKDPHPFHIDPKLKSNG